MDSKKNIACYCNNVANEKVVEAIKDGASTLSKIYDSTGAGTGPCGGSCRGKLKELLQMHGIQKSQGEPKTIEAEIPYQLIEALSLFNRRYYWETHEVLENIWKDANGRNKIFYQAIIQTSAALYHVLNANPQGVLRLASDAKNKLQSFLPEFKTIPLENLISSLDAYLIQAKEILGNTRSGFDYDSLPRLKIGTEMD